MKTYTAEELANILSTHRKWLSSEPGGSRADLRGAYLRGAYLSGADLRGAKITWESHDLVAEILRREAGQMVEKRKVAGLILLSRDWCWEQFLALDDPLRDWALDILAAFVQEGDDTPAALRARVKAVRT